VLYGGDEIVFAAFSFDFFFRCFFRSTYCCVTLTREPDHRKTDIFPDVSIDEIPNFHHPDHVPVKGVHVMRRRGLSDSQSLDRMNLIQTDQSRGSSHITKKRIEHLQNFVPRIGRVAPLGAPNHVATLVHIFGQNFEGGDLYKCKFGDVTVPATFDAASHEIQCTAPAQPHTRGVVPLHVVIFNNANHRVHHRASQDRGFRYYDSSSPSNVPILLSLSPSSGSVRGGTRVTIKGEGFVHTDKLRCKFGSEIVTPIKFFEPHLASDPSPSNVDPAAVLTEKIVCITPSYARDGVVRTLKISLSFFLFFSTHILTKQTQNITNIHRYPFV